MSSQILFLLSRNPAIVCNTAVQSIRIYSQLPTNAVLSVQHARRSSTGSNGKTEYTEAAKYIFRTRRTRKTSRYFNGSPGSDVAFIWFRWKKGLGLRPTALPRKVRPELSPNMSSLKGKNNLKTKDVARITSLTSLV